MDRVPDARDTVIIFVCEVPMTEPVIAQKAPYPVEIEKGKRYAWCRCGRSARQPFCDGTHKTTDLTPYVFTAEETKKVFFCGCKRTGKQPFCDGIHKSL
jgi:CDGSH-type Zn-finger protein